MLLWQNTTLEQWKLYVGAEARVKIPVPGALLHFTFVTAVSEKASKKRVECLWLVHFACEFLQHIELTTC